MCIFHSKKCTFFYPSAYLHVSLTSSPALRSPHLWWRFLDSPGKSKALLKKSSWKKTKLFWLKIDFEILIGKISKIFETRKFHWIFNENLKISKIFGKSKIFEILSFSLKIWIFQWKSKKSKISSFENFRFFFDQNFKIDFRSKNSGLFSWTFF